MSVYMCVCVCVCVCVHAHIFAADKMRKKVLCVIMLALELKSFCSHARAHSFVHWHETITAYNRSVPLALLSPGLYTVLW